MDGAAMSGARCRRARIKAWAFYPAAFALGWAVLIVLSAASRGQVTGQRETMCEPGVWSVLMGRQSLTGVAPPGGKARNIFARLALETSAAYRLGLQRVPQASSQLPLSHGCFDAARSRIVIYRSTLAKA